MHPAVWWGLGALVLLVVLCAAGGVGLGLWFADTLSKPVQSISRFYNAVDAGRCDEARGLIENRELAAIDWCARWRDLDIEGNTEPGAVDGGININNGLAQIEWRLEAGGRSHRLTIYLREFSGTWKITDASRDLLPEPRGQDGEPDLGRETVQAGYT